MARLRRLVAAFTLCALCATAPQAGAQDAPGSPPAGPGAAPVIRTLREIAIHPEREASAQVVSLNESRVAAEISGRILAIAAQAGARVAAGQVIATLECRDHELALERAEAATASLVARLDLANGQLQRGERLAAKGFVSSEALAGRRTEVNVLRAELRQSRVQIDSARRTVGKCTVHAPFNAIVTRRIGQVGELAVPGAPLVALLDAERIEVTANVQPEESGSLQRASAIRFSTAGGEHPVRLLRISPALDAKSRTLEARLTFDSQPAAAGSAGRIVWNDTQPHVPASLLVRRGGKLGVFVLVDGRARFRAIEAAQEGRPAPVTLPGATPLVVAGQLRLQDGAPLGAGDHR